MKITILANKDLAAHYALNLLLPHLGEHQISLFFSKSVGGNTPKHNELLALQNFEQSLLNEQRYLSGDWRAGLPHESSFAPPVLGSFAQLSELSCLPVTELNAINSGEEFAVFSRTTPDLVISIRYGVILQDSVISVPQFGVLNLHSGLLPQYQGVMATFWAMLNGDRDIGATLHYIVDRKIDSGPIIGHTKQVVDLQRSYLWNVLAMYPQGVQEILNTVAAIESGINVTTHKSMESSRYYSFPCDIDIKNFLSKGHKLFDAKEFMPMTESSEQK